MTRYKYPEGYGPTAFEIEHFKKRKRVRRNGWWFVLGFMLMLTFLFFIVAKVVDDQAHASYQAHKELCDQYLKDSSLDGTAAQQTLNQICL